MLTSDLVAQANDETDILTSVWTGLEMALPSTHAKASRLSVSLIFLLF